jgi:two-component system cell cycle sensor histidine kinase/response regulator CckA
MKKLSQLEQFSDIYNKIPIMLHSIDQEGKIQFVSDFWLKKMGYERDEVIGRKSVDFLTDESKVAAREAIPEFMSKGEVWNQPYEMVKKNGEIIEVLLSADSLKDNTSEVVSSIAVIVDVTEKSRLEELLKKSEERYRNVFDYSGFGVGFYEPDGTIISYNNLAAKYLMGKPEDFEGKNIKEIFPEEQAKGYLRRIEIAINSDDFQEYEDKIELPGESKYFKSRISCVFDDDGNLQGIQIVSSDVTDIKEIEKELTERNERLKVANEIMSDYSYCHKIVDGTFKPMWTIGNFEKISGYSPEELHQLGGWAILIHPEDLPKAEQYVSTLLSGKKCTVRCRIKAKDGEVRWVEDSGKPIIDEESGEVVGTYGSARDVTDEVNYELELKEKEEFLSVVFDNSEIGIFVVNVDENGNYSYSGINPCHERLVGIKNEEVIGLSPEELAKKLNYNQDTIDYIIGVYDECVSSRETVESEHFLLDRGERIWWLTKITPVIDEITDRVVRLIGQGIIITEQKEAEEELLHAKQLAEENEKRFRMMFENHDAVMLLIEPYTGQILGINKSAKKFYGYTEEEFRGRKIQDLNQLSADEVKAEREKALKNNKNYFEFEHKLASGEIRNVEVHSTPIDYQNEQILFSIIHDITDRVQAQNRLDSSERLLREMADNFPNSFVSIIEKDMTVSFLSGQEFVNMGINPDDITGQTISEIYGDNASYIEDNYRKTFEGEEQEFEGYFFDQFHLYKTVPLYENGEVNRILAVVENITLKKEAEFALKNQADALDTIFENVPNILLLVDKDGRVANINQKGVMLAGRKKDKLLGLLGGEVFNCLTSFDGEGCGSNRDCLSCPIRTRVNKSLDTGKPIIEEEGRMTFLDNGKQIVMDLLISSIPININNEDMVLLVLSDITERKKAENLLKESKVFLDSITDAAYIADTQGKLVWVNAAAKEIVGYEAEEIIGKPFAPLINPKDHESLLEVYQRSLQGESLENTLTFNSGKTCIITSIPKYDENGKIIGTFGIARDITERIKSERELEWSEQRLKKSQEVARIGNWEYDLATGKVWGSALAFELFGLKRTNEFLSLDEVEMRISESERVNKALQDLIQEGKNYDIEYEITRKIDGKKVIIHSMAEMLYDKNRNPVKVLGVIRDVTEKRKDERELKASKANLLKSQKVAKLGSYEWDLVTDEVIWSDEMYKIFEVDKEHHKPNVENFAQFIHPDDLDKNSKEQFAKVTSERFHELEYRVVVGEEKKIKHVHIWGETIFDKNGSPIKINATLQDITEMKKTEEALKESEKKYRLLAENTHETIWMRDLNFKLKYVNDSIIDFLGYSPEEYSSMEMADYTDEESLKLIEEKANSMVSNFEKGIYDQEVFEIRQQKKDGSFVDVEIRTNLSLNEKGEIIGFQGRSIDITEKKKTEIELQKVSKLESLGVLAGGIAHNFKNILTAMSLSASIAKLRPAKSEKHLNKISKLIDQAAALANRFQTFSKSDKPMLIKSDINKIIIESVEMSLTGSSVSAKFDLDRNLPEIMVDDKQMNEVFTNLLINATQAMTEGGNIYLTTYKEYLKKNDVGELEQGTYLVAEVKDEGSGIPDDLLSNIFTPFFTTKEEGNGLGLASVYNIISKHKGNISVSSEVGVGTIFTIHLPITTNSDKISPDQIEFSRKVRVLVFDENREILDSVVELFEDVNIEFIRAHSVEETLTKYNSGLETGGFDAVMTEIDINENEQKYLDLISDLQVLNPDVKILLYTENFDLEYIAELAKYGFSGKVKKPIDLRQFMSELHLCLGE